MRDRSRWFHFPTASAAFAGMLGAGVTDVAVTYGQGRPPLAPLLFLGVGLYGLCGVIGAVVLGWAAAVVTGWLVPTEAEMDPRRWDETQATALLCLGCGALVLAVGAGAGQAWLVGPMASARLATLASAGLVLVLVPVAALLALAMRGLARRLVRVALPAPQRLGQSGLLLLFFGGLGMLAGAGALSRADWRVLDLSPWGSLAVALLLGSAHGLFWSLTATGRRWSALLPPRPLRLLIPVVLLGALPLAAQVPEGSPVYRAITDHGLALRFLVKQARVVTDRDGDGFSALFGGGDCNDHRADTFPGAEDTPGDGIDQNCEGGDAHPEASAPDLPPTAAAAPAVARPPGSAFDGNILVISIDATRADRLGVAGYGRPPGQSLTPTLDALAQRGAYFRRVWSQAPNTPRSFPSLLTSRFPSEIAWKQRALNYSPILPSNETFFDHLGRAGLRPIGIFSHFYFTADRGLAKGFAEWSNDGAGTIAESNQDVAAPRIVPRVIARLRTAASRHERFVLWTHLFEPHSSYVEHKEFPSSLSGVAGLEERYDHEIAFVDRWIGKIIQALQSTGLANNTAVVVLADHGEAWGEHKLFFHGQDLSEEQLRVPLIIAVPGQAPLVADDEVALVDVGPTLLDLVGAPIPPAFRGRSLLPRLQGKQLAPRPIFAELLPAHAWPKHETMTVVAGQKLTHKITERRYELHDLLTDPRQQRDLAGDARHAALLTDLRARLLRFEEGKR